MPLQAISLDDLRPLGSGLTQPEDVVVGRDGRVWASDDASACAQLLPDGSVRRVGKAGGKPNGINMDDAGRIVIANWGLLYDQAGPLQRLDVESGVVEVLCAEVGGVVLRASNYPILDRHGNIWCTNSTVAESWGESMAGRADGDGFVFRLSADGVAVKAADGLQFANGLALDADETHLYVCQTSGGNILRYPIGVDDTLGAPSRYGPQLSDDPNGGGPDGCGFDQDGNLWVTFPGTNRVSAITPTGTLVTVVEDPAGTILDGPTNVSWGGADLRDLYIGSVRLDHVLMTRSPVPGLPLLHQR